MLQGTCIDSEILPVEETFFLFPVGTDYVYASRFPRKGAHTGCYEKKNFRIAEVNQTAEWLPEPPRRTVEIECQAIYAAELIWCWEHSKKMIGKTYFVIARGSGTHVDVYENNELNGLLGCFPINWFEHFEAVDQLEAIEIIETASDQVVEEAVFDASEEQAFFEQMKLF